MPDVEIDPGRSTDRRVRLTGAACPTCHGDLASLPDLAKFCNRCGTALSDTGPSNPKPTAAHWLRNLWCACPGADAGGDAFTGRSSVLLAFGKSMFNLGWRYGHAVGASRNPDEAARCYSKAARMGDPSAMRRLGRALQGEPRPCRPAPVHDLPFARQVDLGDRPPAPHS